MSQDTKNVLILKGELDNVVGDFASTTEARKHLASGELGAGKFHIVTIHQSAEVVVETVQRTEIVGETKFGARGPRKKKADDAGVEG